MAQEHKPGLMEKIKEKFPGHHHGPDLSGDTEETVPRGTEETTSHESLAKAGTPRAEKKSVVQKIKDKLLGHHDKENSGPDAYETPATHSDEYPVQKTNIDNKNGPDFDSRKAGAKKPGMGRNNSF